MTARVVLHPGPGQTAGDLCRDLIAISGRRDAVRSTGGRGFAVDRDLALLYLQNSTGPAGDVDAPPPAGPVPDSPPGGGLTPADDGGESGTTTATPPPEEAAPAGATVRPRRVPTRKATMKGNPDGE